MRSSSWAAYSVNLERFVLVDRDSWPLLHTAKLLSSKFSPCVCAIEDHASPLRPLDYTLENPSNAKQDQQVPLLVPQIQKIKLKETDIEMPLDILYSQIDYAELSLKIVKASWIVDSMYNDSDHSFYLNLLNEKGIETKKDSAGLEDKFLHLIDRIIYQSDNVAELNSSLENIFDTKKSIRPTNLKIYKSTFYKLLEETDG